jgi:hypothetical protein
MREDAYKGIIKAMESGHPEMFEEDNIEIDEETKMERALMNDSLNIGPTD